MTWNDLGDTSHEEGGTGCNIPIQDVYILPVTRCLRVFRIVFFQNWPDLLSPISEFRDIHFTDAATDINRWKFQGDRSVGVALTNIQTSSEVRSLDVTWWHDLKCPGSEIFTACAEKTHVKVCKNDWRSVLPLLRYVRKPEGEGSKVLTPYPGKVWDQVILAESHLLGITFF